MKWKEISKRIKELDNLQINNKVKKFYQIKVVAHISNDIYSSGYFTKCYKAITLTGEKKKNTFIGYSNKEDEIKHFNTLSEAKRKLQFLKEKIEENIEMFDWELCIEEV